MQLSTMSHEEQNNVPCITHQEKSIETESEKKGEEREQRVRRIIEQQEIFAYLFNITADLSTEEIQGGEKMEILLSPSWQKLSLKEKIIQVTTTPIQGRVHKIMHNASLQDVCKIKAYLSDSTTPDIDPRMELMGLWIKEKSKQSSRKGRKKVGKTHRTKGM